MICYSLGDLKKNNKIVTDCAVFKVQISRELNSEEPIPEIMLITHHMFFSMLLQENKTDWKIRKEKQNWSENCGVGLCNKILVKICHIKIIRNLCR